MLLLLAARSTAACCQDEARAACQSCSVEMVAKLKPYQHYISTLLPSLKLHVCPSYLAEPLNLSLWVVANHYNTSSRKRRTSTATSSLAPCSLFPNHLLTVCAQDKVSPIAHLRSLIARLSLRRHGQIHIHMVDCLLAIQGRIILTTCREHDADDVYVTGTFDDWKKTVQLEKEGGIFKKTVELPKVKTQYKVRLHRGVHADKLPPSTAA